MIRRKISFPGLPALKRQTTAQVAQLAARFEARIMIECESKVINAKSMLGLLSLGSRMDGAEMVLVAEGEDEQKAVEAICALLADERRAEA